MQQTAYFLMIWEVFFISNALEFIVFEICLIPP